MGFGLILLNIKLQQDDRTICCGHKIVLAMLQIQTLYMNKKKLFDFKKKDFC